MFLGLTWTTTRAMPTLTRMIGKTKAQGPNAWTPVRENLQNDIRVLSESAKKRGIEIINLNPDPWYDSFEVGELK